VAAAVAAAGYTLHPGAGWGRDYWGGEADHYLGFYAAINVYGPAEAMVIASVFYGPSSTAEWRLANRLVRNLRCRRLLEGNYDYPYGGLPYMVNISAAYARPFTYDAFARFLRAFAVEIRAALQQFPSAAALPGPPVAGSFGGLAGPEGPP
jgi:hypothetical protein